MYFHRPVIFPCWASRASGPEHRHLEDWGDTALRSFAIVPLASCHELMLTDSTHGLHAEVSKPVAFHMFWHVFPLVNGYRSISAGCFGVKTRVLVHPQMCKSGNMSISEHILASCSCFHLFPHLWILWSPNVTNLGYGFQQLQPFQSQYITILNPTPGWA